LPELRPWRGNQPAKGRMMCILYIFFYLYLLIRTGQSTIVRDENELPEIFNQGSMIVSGMQQGMHLITSINT
jgi:hypothetical protein